MAYRQDYILRMIDQLTAVILRIAGFRREGDDEAALAATSGAVGRLTGLSPSLVHALSEEDLVNLLTARGAVDAGRALAVAELLREEAAIYADQGNEAESYPRDLKALRLYLEVLPEIRDAGRGEPPGLAEVIERLEGYELPPATEARLSAHFEASGHFARAEEALRARLDPADPDPALLDRLRAFYQRLLARPDAELAAGCLPRAEVREALAALPAESSDG